MNKKIWGVNIRKMLIRFNKRIFICCVPALALICAALVVTLAITIPGIQNVPLIVRRMIFSCLSLALLYAFVVCTVGGIVADMRLKMHKSHSFIQINEKSLVISEFSDSDRITGKAFVKMWVCDIRDIDDIVAKKDRIIFKLRKGSTAKTYREPSDWLSMHETDSGLAFDDWTADGRGSAAEQFSIHDNYICTDRIIQRIFLVAGNVREREARRKRFNAEMLERAANVRQRMRRHKKLLTGRR